MAKFKYDAERGRDVNEDSEVKLVVAQPVPRVIVRMILKGYPVTLAKDDVPKVCQLCSHETEEANIKEDVTEAVAEYVPVGARLAIAFREGPHHGAEKPEDDRYLANDCPNKICCHSFFSLEAALNISPIFPRYFLKPKLPKVFSSRNILMLKKLHMPMKICMVGKGLNFINNRLSSKSFTDGYKKNARYDAAMAQHRRSFQSGLFGLSLSWNTVTMKQVSAARKQPT